MQLNKIIAGALLLFPGIAFGQKAYTLQGEISGMKGPAVLYVRDGKENIDTVKIRKNGRFILKGQVTEPKLLQLLLVDKGREKISGKADTGDYSLFVLEPGLLKIAGKDSIKYVMVNSPLNDERRAILEKAESRLDNKKKLEEAYQKALAGKQRADIGMARQSLEFEKQKLTAILLTDELEYVRTHPASYLSVWMLEKHALSEDFLVLQDLYVQFSPEMKNSTAGKNIHQRIEQRRFIEIGGIPPDFQQADTTGKMVSLYSFRGKYVLIDFWASWCGPCRKENPNVLDAYEAFKDKGLEILGVSLDEAKQKKDWIKAIDFDGLQWTQVCDFGGFNNKAAQLFNIRSIPQNVLLDPEGKVIAKNLRGKALKETLSKFIK